MRDINRLKEKYELSLDSRHVVGLTVGGLVALRGSCRGEYFVREA